MAGGHRESATSPRWAEWVGAGRKHAEAPALSAFHCGLSSLLLALEIVITVELPQWFLPGSLTAQAHRGAALRAFCWREGRLCVCVWGGDCRRMCVCMYQCQCVWTWVCVCAHENMGICVCVCTWMCMHVHVCVQLHSSGDLKGSAWVSVPMCVHLLLFSC